MKLPGSPAIVRASPPAGPTVIQSDGCAHKRALASKSRKLVAANPKRLPHSNPGRFGDQQLKAKLPHPDYKESSYSRRENDTFVRGPLYVMNECDELRMISVPGFEWVLPLFYWQQVKRLTGSAVSLKIAEVCDCSLLPLVLERLQSLPALRRDAVLPATLWKILPDFRLHR